MESRSKEKGHSKQHPRSTGSEEPFEARRQSDVIGISLERIRAVIDDGQLHGRGLVRRQRAEIDDRRTGNERGARDDVNNVNLGVRERLERDREVGPAAGVDDRARSVQFDRAIAERQSARCNG